MSITNDLKLNLNTGTKMSAHTLSSIIYMVVNNLMTIEDARTKLNLSVDSSIDFDNMIASFSLLSENEKLAIYGKMESLNIMFQDGFIDEQTYNLNVGISGSGKVT